MNKSKTLYLENANAYALQGKLHKFKDIIFHDNSNDFMYHKLMQRWNHFKNCNKILDVGSGNGDFLKLNPYYKEIVGIDYNTYENDKLRKDGFWVIDCDLNNKLPFNDNSFDGVALFHVLEHFFYPNHLMSEITRVLKNDGLLVISVPYFNFKHFYEDYTHKKPYPKIALYRLLNDLGYKDIKITNGIAYSIIGRCLFLFPKLRFNVEKFIGKFYPFEITVTARCRK